MAGLKRRSVPQEEGSSTSTFTNLVDGEEYEGRLVYVADLGLHTREYKGEVKTPCQKLSLGIEILGETVTIDDVEKPRILWTNPFNIFYQLTEKGRELEYINVFDKSYKDGDEAEWGDMLDLPCSVTVKLVKKDENTYDNIDCLTAVPRKFQKGWGKSTIEPAIGDADDEDNVVTKALFGLSRWMYEQRIQEGSPASEQQDPPFDPDDDEIPY